MLMRLYHKGNNNIQITRIVPDIRPLYIWYPAGYPVSVAGFLAGWISG